VYAGEAAGADVSGAEEVVAALDAGAADVVAGIAVVGVAVDADTDVGAADVEESSSLLHAATRTRQDAASVSTEPFIGAEYPRERPEAAAMVVHVFAPRPQTVRLVTGR